MVFFSEGTVTASVVLRFSCFYSIIQSAGYSTNCLFFCHKDANSHELQNLLSTHKKIAIVETNYFSYFCTFYGGGGVLFIAV